MTKTDLMTVPMFAEKVRCKPLQRLPGGVWQVKGLKKILSKAGLHPFLFRSANSERVLKLMKEAEQGDG